MLFGMDDLFPKVLSGVLQQKDGLNLTKELYNLNRLYYDFKPNSVFYKPIPTDWMFAQELLIEKEILCINLVGFLLRDIGNLLLIIKNSNVQHIIFIGNAEMFYTRPHPIYEPYRCATEIIANSGISYTIIFPGWLTVTKEINYEIVTAGEHLLSSYVSVESMADIILRVIENPHVFSNQCIGITRA